MVDPLALRDAGASWLMPSTRLQGQFASKAFDGDPYIEIMRELPDKELCWWIQKVIWVSMRCMQRPNDSPHASMHSLML